MKRLFVITLAIVLVLGISGMVLAAGNDADIEQDGNNQIADVNQYGDDNETDVYQKGSYNETYVDQDGDENKTDVTQNGEENEAYVDQEVYSNNANIYQDGEFNIAGITQNGDENEANITQSAYTFEIGPFGPFYIGPIGPFGPFGPFDFELGSSDNNIADVFQDGDDNQADIEQFAGQFNLAYVTQYQDGNDADITQSTYPFVEWSFPPFSVDAGLESSNNNIASVWQDGLDNTADIDQLAGQFNWAYITQYQDENEANITQSAYPVSELFGADYLESDDLEAVYNIASVFQDGLDNTADIRQLAGDYNSAFIFQDGDENDADILQTGNDNLASIWQSGVANVSDIQQTSNDNTAYTWQVGTGNDIALEQKAGSSYNGDNEFYSTQFGEGNQIKGVDEAGCDLTFNESKAAEQWNGAEFYSYQTGTDNKIGLRQGLGDFGAVWQDGENNEALLYQHGATAHTALISQNGNGNTAEVCQKQ